MGNAATAQMVLWGIVFVLAAILEAATMQLVTIWFCVGALAAFIAAALGFSFMAQAILFTAVSVILLCVTRPLLRKIRVQNVPAMNADGEVGKLAIVTESIDAVRDTGRVRIGGVNWRARPETEGETFAEGASVRVARIEGTTAFVTAETP